MLDHLLNNKIPIGRLSALDFLPTENELLRLHKSYIIACKVEGKSASTLTIYSQVIGDFIVNQASEVSDVHHITAQHIRLFLLSFQERKLAPASVNAYYRVLNTFFNWLVAEGFIEKSPMDNIKPPKLTRKVIQPFSAEDLGNLLLLCSSNTFLALRNRAIILTFLDTGLRLAELANIQLKDINFDNETLRMLGKGSKERIVRVGRATQRAILKYILTRKDNLPCLWITEERQPLTRNGVQTTIKRLCHRAEVRDAKPGPHTFRHTSAIHYLRNGGSEFTLQRCCQSAKWDTF